MDFPLDYVRGCFHRPGSADAVDFRNASAPWELATVRAAKESRGRDEDPEEIREETRESLAVFLNSNEAWAAEEIVFAPDVSELAQRLSLGLARRMERGDEVVLTEIDEEWSLAPWLALEERGIAARFWRLRPPEGGLDAADLPHLLTGRTRVVVAAKASATIGTIVELLPLALQVRDRRSSLVVNWTPFLAHGAVDVRFLRSDFVIASASTLFGSRMAFLWGRRERMQELRLGNPRIFDGLETDPRDVAALGAALRYVEELGLLSQEMQIQPSEDYGRRRHMRRGMQAIRHYERTLTTLVLERLAAVPGITVYGIDDSHQSARRLPHFFFGLSGKDPAEVASRLERENVRVEYGSFGSPRAVRALGLPEREGAVSASLAHYNTEAEVERFAEALLGIAT
ncbi:MAG TPA: aminotransferase class V-fold PLP-dependent enzyme [Vicinamibacteria bacterium]